MIFLSRNGAEPLEDLKAIAQSHVGPDRRIHGAAIVKAGAVREAELEIVAQEPPPRHANIAGWPTAGDDPELAKAQCKARAGLIAQRAEAPLRFSV